MVSTLDEACHQSSDLFLGRPIQVISKIHTGRRGCPRTEINPQFLQYALELRGPTGISKSLQTCSSRTVRCRALEYGFVEPGDPVCMEEEHPDGEVVQVYTSIRFLVSASKILIYRYMGRWVPLESAPYIVKCTLWWGPTLFGITMVSMVHPFTGKTIPSSTNLL